MSVDGHPASRGGEAIGRVYQRLGPRYLAAYTAVYLSVSALLCVIALLVFLIYEPMTAGELLRTWLVAEAVLLLALGTGAVRFHREARPIQRWIDGDRSPASAEAAWRTAIVLPRRALGFTVWRAVLMTALPLCVYVGLTFDYSLGTTLLFFVGLLGAAIWPAVVSFFTLELLLRPILREAAQLLPPSFQPPEAPLPLRRKLMVSLPLINVITGGFVGVLATATTDGTLAELGATVLAAVVVACTISLVLTLLLTRSILRPVGDLVDATLRIHAGDLSASVPVVSADELGTLSRSFNAMTAEMLASRQRLVEAREEERRRLRRELHDGVGPTLAAFVLQLDAARRLTGTDPARADDMLRGLQRETQRTVDEVRRLVDELRPPALDDLGLVGALRERAAGFAAGDMTLNVEAPDELPPLPAAVEVAAYRIVQEAMTNVVRHSGARRCDVRIACDRALELEVTDDGRGLPAGGRQRVGLTSMRERAAEVGGLCEVTPRPAGGTRVHARIPVGGA